MQPKILLAIAATFIAATTAVPTAQPEIEVLEDRAELEARQQSWTAVGGCKTDWAKKCYAQCVGEGVTKHKCKQASVSSGIESSHCLIGWNICRCHC